jgi:hypothetical protein
MRILALIAFAAVTFGFVSCTKTPPPQPAPSSGYHK